MGKNRKKIKDLFSCSNGDHPLHNAADFIFGSDLDESDYLYLLRKLDRYENGSSYSSEPWMSPVDGEDTTTSKFVALHATDSIEEGPNPTCKKKLKVQSKLEDTARERHGSIPDLTETVSSNPPSSKPAVEN